MHLVRFLSAPGFVEPIREKKMLAARKRARAKDFGKETCRAFSNFLVSVAKTVKTIRDVSALQGHPQH